MGNSFKVYFKEKNHQYRKKWTSKTGLESTFYLIECELWPHYGFYDFKAYFEEKNHQYRKNWTSKTGLESTFYLIERELWQNYGFYYFKAYFEEKISPISKKVNLQNWPRINFLPNRTRVMAELRFLRF